MTTQTQTETRTQTPTSPPDAPDVHAFFGRGGPDVEGLARWLQARPFTERVAAVRALGRREQAALFEAAAGHRPLEPTHLVPAALPPLTPVIHFGKNSLPAFSRFEKRFLRPGPEEGAEPGTLWGYNEQPLRRLVGPGYFVARAGERGELLIDYIERPGRVPAFWPAFRPNERGLSRLVYAGMIDVLRGVTGDVSIGRATRKGKPLDNWFALVREPAAG